MKKTLNITTFQKVKILVAQIPEGKVSTYGSVAQVLGINSARVVGWALRNNNLAKVPCHRVVNKEGQLAKDFSLGGWQEQRARLLPEHVHFVDDNKVEMKLDYWNDFTIPENWGREWENISSL